MGWRIDCGYGRARRRCYAFPSGLPLDVRLSVLLDAAEPVSGGAVPAATATGSLVHATPRARLDPAHAQRIIGITDDGDNALIALRACQAYVRAVAR